jgi:predicted metal-dependent hydrolase
MRHVVEEEIEMDQGIKDGIFYFNNERFWECHEAFEGVWKQCFGREKELVQGIILVAVAYAHAQANELSIGVAMLTRALEKLGRSPSMYHSIDVERIRNKSIEMQKINDLVLFEI